MPRHIPQKTLIAALADTRTEPTAIVAKRYNISVPTIRKWRRLIAKFPTLPISQQYQIEVAQREKPISNEAISTARTLMAFLTAAIAQSDPQNTEHIDRALQGVEAVSSLMEAVRA
jgi:hypothetical protein